MYFRGFCVCLGLQIVYNGSRTVITNQPQSRAKEARILALAIWREGSFHLA